MLDSLAANRWVKDEVAEWRRDPVYFCQTYTKFEAKDWQPEALQHMANGETKIAIRSGHGVGKTAWLANAIWWFVFTHSPFKVPCTAPTGHQLDDLLWGELSKWYKKMPKEMQGLFKFVGDHIRPVEDVTNKGETYVVKRTARAENPDALQGFHSDHMLYVVDEGSGVPASVYEVARGALTKDSNILLMTGNPTRSSGYFFDAFTKHRERYKTLRVDCRKSSLVSETYIEDMLSEHGEESNVFRIRVAGEFPIQDEDAVIRLDAIEDCITRGPNIKPWGSPVWGIDVGGSGETADRSVLVKRTGNLLLEKSKYWTGKDHEQLAATVTEEFDKTPELMRPVKIYIDSIGFGAPLVSTLVANGLPAVGVNVAESPAMKHQYRKLRDELFVAMRDWIHSASTGWAEDDPHLAGQLPIVRWGVGSGERGVLYIESKRDTKKRLLKETGTGKSPDHADALMLTFQHRYTADSAFTGYTAAYNRMDRIKNRYHAQLKEMATNMVF